MNGPVPGLPPLLEAVLNVGTDLELRVTLQHIVDSAAELTGAGYAALSLTDPGYDGLVGIRTAGASPDAPSQDAPSPNPGPSPSPDLSPAPSPGGTGRSGSSLGVPIRVDDEVFGTLHLAGKRAGGRFTRQDGQLLHLLATQAGIAIGNARLYETARQRERWIEGAAAVTTALLTGESAADALMTVAERARVLADAAAGVILQATPEGGMEIVTASTLDDPGDIVGTVIEPGSPVLVQLLGGEPVYIEDSATDPRMTTHVRARFGPSMMLPLQADGRLIGTLALPRRRGGRPYTSVERLLATQFASQAALALVLADAQHRRERLAVYEDRDRIARDLHDLVVQRLFATGMMLESTQRRAAGAGTGTGRDGTGTGRDDTGDDTDDVHATLGRAVDELQSTIQEVRTAIFALQQPPADAPTTFRGKVLRETAAAAATLGFQPSVHFTGPVENRVTEPVAGHLLTALRRKLTAASRRPGVSRVQITVDATATLPNGRPGLVLTVHDDGVRDDGEGSGTTVTWRSPL
ncbi:GAF domain-containing sensor histidine kinase [Streptomyces sp. NPDC050535]|uniref:GAF domain-containing sensor histidine kinase n=1 Tax=Streptomyces sp. NPDC050535 TaxID=3365626 RepID=UPI0037978825